MNEAIKIYENTIKSIILLVNKLYWYHVKKNSGQLRMKSKYIISKIKFLVLDWLELSALLTTSILAVTIQDCLSFTNENINCSHK